MMPLHVWHKVLFFLPYLKNGLR